MLGDPRAAFLISGMTTSQSEDQMFLVRAIEKHSNIDWVKWEGWHAFRRGLATNLHALGVKPAVRGTLLGSDGKPVKGFVVIDDILGGSPPERRQTVTDGRGKIEFIFPNCPLAHVRRR